MENKTFLQKTKENHSFSNLRITFIKNYPNKTVKSIQSRFLSNGMEVNK